jgi:hypothetical protein
MWRRNGDQRQPLARPRGKRAKRQALVDAAAVAVAAHLFDELRHPQLLWVLLYRVVNPPITLTQLFDGNGAERQWMGIDEIDRGNGAGGDRR